ncbi:hypothetical protein [Amycolatopsis sp. WQ 127309]|uniref:hypothetical protein n=1 Tax=Amycolatopsis sp. WQ 127309 TaxID=2932773 RepID=UPI001FF26B7C|nr:hypothetical protein [Amycolatopsis sp. WQ 127309]UOZ10543.1 hypothetical protein MUY22_20670 [Amycolatopsis sp. WQ 127309]
MRLSGPLFNGDPGRILDDAMREIEHQVGVIAEQDLRSQLGHVLRHPTGRYVSKLRVATQAGLVRVDDQRSVYGPWLEGTGSHNARSRFKGYATFRKVTQQLDRKAGQIAKTVLARYVGRIQ